MNESNLIPLNKRSKEAQREIQEKGRQANREKQKRLKTLKESMKVLLKLKPSEQIKQNMANSLGIPEEEITDNAMVINTALFGKAVSGDVRAWEQIHKLTGKPEESEDIKIKREELRIKQEEHEITMAKWKEERKALEERINKYRGIPALSIAPLFLKPLREINDHNCTEYVFKGGRGSTKSSFISLCIIDLLMKHEDLNALVMRQVGNTIRDSVYNQLVWAIDELGLNDEWECTVSPAKMVRKGTEQTIFFRGADDPNKVKSVKPTKGYIGILWFEELDQFLGAESVRKIEQSTMRGGNDVWVFKSFNPPRTALNWANKYVLIPKETRLTNISNYLDVPKEWLGKAWLDEAEYLKEINPKAYENEYLGEVNGTGGNVFENIEIREITDEEIKNFDRPLNGVDWGWYPDPYQYIRCYFDVSRRTLYIFCDYRCNKTDNQTTANELKKHYIQEGEIVICDSAENKSVGDYRAFGIAARGVEKGPGSVGYSMKWLQSLAKIVIDPIRCPNATREFAEYEYERDKEGNVITGYPDKNNHAIDATRYATSPIWKKKGQ